MVVSTTWKGSLWALLFSGKKTNTTQASAVIENVAHESGRIVLFFFTVELLILVATRLAFDGFPKG